MTTPKTPAGSHRIAPDALSSEIPADVDTRTDAEKAEDEEIAAANRDKAGANLVPAEPGDIAAGATVLTPSAPPELEGDEKDWAKVVIVADAPAKLPAHKDAKVIVAERRTQPGEDGKGAGQFDAEADYSKNADAYVGYYQHDAQFAEIPVFPNAGDKPVFLMGQNVRQFGLGGVSRQKGYLSVGPGHPVYVAVNLALQHGAEEVTITGLTDHDKAVVGPWLDKIAGEFKTLDYGQSKD